MKVLVTGGAGFVGSHIVDRLVTFGHDVEIWDDFSTGRIGNCTPSAKVVHRSIVGGDMAIEEIHADVVIHAAAKADISANWTSHTAREELLRTNIEGTRLLLEACAAGSVKGFVFLSTAAVYGDGGAEPYNTKSPIRASSPYTASKIAGEMLVQAYAERFGWRTGIARLVSAVGARYSHGHIADFVGQMKY